MKENNEIIKQCINNFIDDFVSNNYDYDMINSVETDDLIISYIRIINKYNKNYLMRSFCYEIDKTTNNSKISLSKIRYTIPLKKTLRYYYSYSLSFNNIDIEENIKQISQTDKFDLMKCKTLLKGLDFKK